MLFIYTKSFIKTDLYLFIIFFSYYNLIKIFELFQNLKENLFYNYYIYIFHVTYIWK